MTADRLPRPLSIPTNATEGELRQMIRDLADEIEGTDGFRRERNAAFRDLEAARERVAKLEQTLARTRIDRISKNAGAAIALAIAAVVLVGAVYVILLLAVAIAGAVS